MSAFAVIFERSNTPADPGVLERAMTRLSHRGPDGSDTISMGRVALGHWHFWTTREEVGERQPLVIDGLPFKLVMDGRLDNRAELFALLQLDPEQDKSLSDAALVLNAYARWGEHCFEYFIGPFAVAIVDEYRGELICARDAIGDCTLFYTLDRDRIIVASEPWAVAGAMGSEAKLDEVGAAHFFMLKAPENGQTMFRNVLELLPAQVLVVGPNSQRTWQYWQADLEARIRFKSSDEYAEQFLAILEQSVKCRLRSTTPVGILMSGGLDSSSVACLAASSLSPAVPTVISYIYNELTECDERSYIDEIVTRWSLNSIQIPCDDAWPLHNWSSWPYNPNQPEGYVYRLLLERAQEHAHQNGLRVLLTGDFGDHLYGNAQNWLADLLAEGMVRESIQELASNLRSHGVRRTLSAGSIQLAGKKVLHISPNRRQLNSKKSPVQPPWLTPTAFTMIPETTMVSERQDGMVGLRTARISSRGAFYGSQHKLEMRFPYRDRRLVEFVLALPAYQLYNKGLYKHILRTAMKDTLPEIIRSRSQPTNVSSLYMRGMEREKDTIMQCLQDPNADWRKFIDSTWILENASTFFSARAKWPDALIPWLCISYDRWYKCHNSLT